MDHRQAQKPTKILFTALNYKPYQTLLYTGLFLPLYSSV